MKKFLSMLAALLIAAASPAQTLVADLNANDAVTVGVNAVGSIDTGKWYVMYNAGRKVYTYGTAYQTETAPTAVATVKNSAAYMIRFVQSSTAGRYYIQNAYGEYFKPLATSTYTGVTSNISEAATFALGEINNTAGHWHLTCSNNMVMDSNGSAVVGYGTDLPTTTGVNKDYNLLEMVISSPDALTGGALAMYQVNKGGLFRIHSRNNTSRYIVENTSTNKGTTDTKNTAEATHMSQIWIIEVNGATYSLRNSKTGNYLQPDYTCTGEKYYWTITLSPNNTQASDPYTIIAHGAVKSGTRNCINLSGGGSGLTDWFYDGDKNSEWVFEPVETSELDAAAVRANLDKVGNVDGIDLTKGIYYTFTNLDNGKLLADRASDNVAITAEYGENNWNQYWKLALNEDGTYTLQNIYTGKFLNRKASSATTSAKGNYMTTAGSAVSHNFNVAQSEYEWQTTYNIIEPMQPGNGVGAASNIATVSGISATSAQWIVNRVALTDEQVAQAAEEYDDFNLLNNTTANVLNSRLQKFFSDYACTTLKDEYKSATDDELTTAMSEGGLPKRIINIALKIKNDTWGHREKEFRIYDYEAYSDPYKWNATTLMATSYLFSPQSGPTGISVKQGDVVLFFVGANPPAATTLNFSSCKDYTIAATQTAIKRGVNVYVAPDDGFLFIHYNITNTSRKLADFDPITIHIEGGRVQGYFDITRGHTNADWKDFAANLFQDKIVHMKSKYYQYNMDYVELLKQIPDAELDQVDTDGVAKGIEGTLHRWDQLVEVERTLTNAKQFDGRFNSMLSASSSSDGNPYATNYGTYYPGVGTIMSYDAMTHGKEYDNGANYWCVAHETGHVHQAPINIAGCTEITVNLFSQVATWMQGSNVGRYAPWSTNRDFYMSNTFWNDYELGQRSRMFFQLWLYFHLMGHDTEFYPKVFDMFRKSPIQQSNDASNPGSGTTDYLKFAKFACDAAQADLSEFFGFWGFYVPIKNYDFDDYSHKYMTTTQAEIDEAIAYMQKYPKKLGNLLFIDERIEKYPADYPGMPAGATRLATTSGSTPGNASEVGDLGMFTYFVDSPEYSAYTCLYSAASGRCMIRNGKGAVGFKVYSAKDELLYASNTYNFTLPLDVRTQPFYIVAALGDGSDRVVYDPKDLTPVKSATVSTDDEAPVFDLAKPAYDLSGQKVDFPLPGGIYIQNGVKVKY